MMVFIIITTKSDKDMTLEEILAVEDIERKIQLLKSHRGSPLPKVKELRDEWDPTATR